MVNYRYFIAEGPVILGYGMPCQLLSSSGILEELSASNFRASPARADFCLLWEVQPPHLKQISVCYEKYNQ